MPARFLTLMNPNRRRSRSRRRLFGAALAAHQRKSGRSRRRVRRNPNVSTRRRRRTSRPSPPKMTTAMRAKISRAVKAANRRRASAPRGIARLFRRRSTSSAVARRSSYRAPARRFFRRRSGGGSRFGGGSLVGAFKSALSKDLLFKAGGAVGASLGVGLLLQRYGSSLPMSNNKWGRVAYSVGIPIAAAYLVRKKNRSLAEGMVIGGLVMGINALISTVRATASPGTVGAYPRVSDFSVAGELGPSNFSYYPQPGNRNLVGTPMNGAFSNSAW